MSDTTKPQGAQQKSGLRIPGFAQLQRLGKSLMLPIAVLPAAGILLRLGQDDLLGRIKAPVIGPFFQAMSAAGDALFTNLPLLFAVGVAIGFARKADGSTALAAVVGYLVMQAVFKTMSPIVLAGEVDKAGDQAQINYSVFAGIVVGLVTAWLFDRYHTIAAAVLPRLLRRPALRPDRGVAGVPVHRVRDELLLSDLRCGADRPRQVHRRLRRTRRVRLRVRQPHADPARPAPHPELVHLVPLRRLSAARTAQAVTGELTRFAAGDPTAGILTSGFYPILMFGLPAAALAMIHVANKKQRKVALGILSAAGLTAFLTGVTEPLEFAFMFVAFPLYLIHARADRPVAGDRLPARHPSGLLVLRGPDRPAPVRHGAGGEEHPAADRAWAWSSSPSTTCMFRFAITKWNMRTPGREPEDEFEAEEEANLGEGADVRDRGGRRRIRRGDRDRRGTASPPTARPSS